MKHLPRVMLFWFAVTCASGPMTALADDAACRGFPPILATEPSGPEDVRRLKEPGYVPAAKVRL